MLSNGMLALRDSVAYWFCLQNDEITGKIGNSYHTNEWMRINVRDQPLDYVEVKFGNNPYVYVISSTLMNDSERLTEYVDDTEIAAQRVIAHFCRMILAHPVGF